VDKKVTYKGFVVGNMYYTRFYESDDNNTLHYPDTEVRLVAITPKVRMTPIDQKHDTGQYFANCDTEDGQRIRVDFCCLKKTNE
jgi:hypothetical protein